MYRLFLILHENNLIYSTNHNINTLVNTAKFFTSAHVLCSNATYIKVQALSSSMAMPLSLLRETAGTDCIYFNLYVGLDIIKWQDVPT
jgi:hypothetical protein